MGEILQINNVVLEELVKVKWDINNSIKSILENNDSFEKRVNEFFDIGLGIYIVEEPPYSTDMHKLCSVDLKKCLGLIQAIDITNQQLYVLPILKDEKHVSYLKNHSFGLRGLMALDSDNKASIDTIISFDMIPEKK